MIVLKEIDLLGESLGRMSPQTLSQGVCELLERPKKGTLMPPVPFLVILALLTAGDLLEPPKGQRSFLVVPPTWQAPRLYLLRWHLLPTQNMCLIPKIPSC